MKIKIGVLGACVTRDVFNSQFVPNYKDFFEIKISAQRVSMISLMQNPLTVDTNDLKILPITPANITFSNFISYDLNKQLLNDLIVKKIDYLIIDTYFEVTLGVMYFQDNIITHDGNLRETKFYQKISDKFIFTIEEYPEEYFRVWVKYCHLFFNFLELNCPNIKVILNKARVIDNIVKDDGTTEINSEFTKKAKIINPFLDKLDSYIEHNFDVEVINFDFKNMSLDENHLWGLAPVHYSNNYYSSVFNRILEIVNNEDEYRNQNKEIFKNMDTFNAYLKIINLETMLFFTKIIIKKLKSSQNFAKSDFTSNLIKYGTGRIDIKNYGSTHNSIEIIENSDESSFVDFPNWFCDLKGNGLVLQSVKGELHLKIKCICDGVFTVFLRGPDIKDVNGRKFQVYIDFIEFQINNKNIFSDSKLVCHDKPYVFRKPVKNNEIIKISIKWMPFNNLSNFIDD